jgi:nitrate reductase gamma subunit
MQEAPQVGWDPISINYHLPWAAKIFVLYLLVVIAISLVKYAGLLRQFWSFTRGSIQGSRSESESQYAWEACSNRIQSIKRLVFVTLLLTVLVSALLLRACLMRIVEQKAFGPAALSGGIVEVLTVFALGILVCAVLYTACALYERMLLRRRTTRNRFSDAQDRPPEA